MEEIVMFFSFASFSLILLLIIMIGHVNLDYLGNQQIRSVCLDLEG